MTASRRRATPTERRERASAVEDPQIVLEAAARYLEARPRTTVEVRRRLAGAGYRPDLVEGAIDRLSALGYLDDAAFARSWVESRDRARPRGTAALRRELHLKGIADGLIREVLAERAAPDVGSSDEAGTPDVAAATRLLERRGAALLREPDPRRRRQRAYALLARNGFDPGVCAMVSLTWLRGSETGPDDADEAPADP